jgi:hypothetical protein
VAKKSVSYRQQIRELRKANAQLRARVEHLGRVDAERQAAMERLHAHIELLTEQNTLLRKALFSRRRERYVPSADQKLLFDPEVLDDDPGEAAPAAHSGPPDSEEEAEEDCEEASSGTKPRRRKRKRFDFPQCLPVRRFEHPLPAEELSCSCGCGDRVVIGRKVSRQLELDPERALGKFSGTSGADC